MGVDLTTAWVEIERLVNSLAPLLREIVSGQDGTYAQYSLVARERLQKVVQLCQLARQASHEVQVQVAGQQLRWRPANSAQVQSVLQAGRAVVVHGDMRTTVNRNQMPVNSGAPAMQQAQLQAHVQPRGMSANVWAAQAGHIANARYQQGQATMEVSPAAGAFAPSGTGTGQLLNPSRQLT